MTTTPFIVEVEAKAVDLFCLFFRMGIQREGGAFPNLKYSLKRRWGEGEKQNGREKVSEREWGREEGRERERKKVAVVEGDLPHRVIERGGEETELHQMKWGENNSGINQARPKGRGSFSCLSAEANAKVWMKNSRVEARQLPVTIESCRSPTAARRVRPIRSVHRLCVLSQTDLNFP